MKQLFILFAAMLAVSISLRAQDFSATNEDGVRIYYNITSAGSKTVEVTNNGYINSDGVRIDCDFLLTDYPSARTLKINTYSDSINIPATVSHGKNTYSVTKIEGLAFFCCTSLSAINIPNSVKEIGGYAFSDCISLRSVTIPNSVKEIGWRAFRYCPSLNSIIIPNSVTTIEGETFYSCTSLSSIIIPNSVTEIGLGAFSGTAWLNNQADGVVYINNLLHTYKGKEDITSIIVNDGTTAICEYAFKGCTSLDSITIPNSVTKIGSGAFRYCLSLNSIIIPNSVTKIGEGAFYNCSALRSISISNSITEIENNMLEGCKSLSSITIPNSVTEIGGWAFNNCTSLSSIVIPSSVTMIKRSILAGCDNIKNVYVEASTPPKIEDMLFGDEKRHRKVPVYVPMASVEMYKKAKVWKEMNIIGYDFSNSAGNKL